MQRLLTAMICAGGLAGVSTAALAQDSGESGEQAAPAQQEAPAAPQEGEGAAGDQLLSMGEDEPGTTYTESTFQDWELRCARNPDGQDPCQLYQLITDGEGNSVAEMSVFPVGGESQAAAGATIVTPLETLLTEQIAVSIDGGPAKQYPFTWCSQVGCFARVGFTMDDLNAFRRGATATLTIVPVAAPDQQVNLSVSLAGFTNGFDAVSERASGASGNGSN